MELPPGTLPLAGWLLFAEQWCTRCAPLTSRLPVYIPHFCAAGWSMWASRCVLPSRRPPRRSLPLPCHCWRRHPPTCGRVWARCMLVLSLGSGVANSHSIGLARQMHLLQAVCSALHGLGAASAHSALPLCTPPPQVVAKAASKASAQLDAAVEGYGLAEDELESTHAQVSCKGCEGWCVLQSMCLTSSGCAATHFKWASLAGRQARHAAGMSTTGELRAHIGPAPPSPLRRRWRQRRGSSCWCTPARRPTPR